MNRERLTRIVERLNALGSRSEKLVVIVSAVTGLALTASRLLGVHGVESALVLGVVVPLFLVPAATLRALAFRSNDAESNAAESNAAPLLSRLLKLALLCWAIPLALLALNQLRVRQCAPLEGLAFEALGPLFGFVFATLLGGLIGSFVPGRRLALALAIIAPLLSLGLGLREFLATPAIFVFSHLHGWFPGTLYDDNIAIPNALLSFRAVTSLLSVGCGALIVARWRPFPSRATWQRSAAPLGIALVCLGLAAVAQFHGSALGHRVTVAHIDEVLGKIVTRDTCVVHLPREVNTSEADRLADDCAFRVHQAAEGLGVSQDEPVHAFFYRSMDEKRSLMGAGRTFIAKPWRGEVHLQLRGWPHPVLAHEVVHAVAANAARGPFKVAASLGGLLPNPGLIEGVAVGVAWDIRDGLDPDIWSRAMLELELLPNVGRLMSLGFLQTSPRAAYSAAGSFVRWYRERFGRDVLREAYRLGDIEGPSGESTAALEAAWHEHLQGVALPESALELARLRFSRPSIFSTTCPHRLAHLRAELAGDLAANDLPEVRSRCREILDIDGRDVSTRAVLVGALARAGDTEAANRELDQLEGAASPVVVAAEMGITDAAWLQGDNASALAGYRALLSKPQSEDRARNVEVKIAALEGGGEQAQLVRRLLLGADGRGSSRAVVVHLAERLRALRDDGLGAYLAARQMHYASEFALAIPLFEEAKRAGLPTDRLARENARLYGAALFAEGRVAEARAHFAQHEDASGVLGEQARDWVARCTFAPGSR